MFKIAFFASCSFILISCAGERQGLVCDELEYRLNTMTYSPDQRAYMEEDLRVCREQETQKKNEGAATRQSIYERFASSDSTQKKDATDSSTKNSDISVANALHDSSGIKTQSIYDRYGSANVDSTKIESKDSISSEIK